VRSRSRALGACALALTPLLTVVGCGGQDDEGRVLTVYAAASLTPSFTELAERFEADHEGVTVELAFAGSSDLVAQILSGAPADVFASADLANMDKLTAEDLQGSEPEVFATNTLQVATPPDNPGGVSGLADLAEEDLAVVVCAPEVPCGAATVAVAEEAGVTLAPDSEEQSVADVLGKVRAGEADAGLVYVTDVIAAAGDVLGIDVPEAAAVVNDYPIATVAGSDAGDLAQEFVELVLGEQGRQVLADAGFGTP
jgi:molybdate transport system substrate-binding protein